MASLRFADQVESTPDPYANQYFFYNYDMRGSTTAIIQPDGTLIKGYSYDEFGALEQSGATDFLNEVTFTGSVTDTSSGLQYMNARFYSPSTGRFLSQDTYTGNASQPWTQHLYSYCGNNPVNMVDPTGHSAEENPDWWTQVGNWFGQAAKDTGAWVSKAANDTGAWVSQAAKDTGAWVGQAAKDTGAWVSQAAKDTGAWVSQAAKDTGTWVSQAVKDTGTWVSQAVKETNDFVSNTDEQAVLDADVVAFYKGKLVVKVPIGQDAFSCGIIFLGDEINEKNGGITTVKHEYGHTVQLANLGFSTYISTVAIPSVTNYQLSKSNQFIYDNYYSFPWEYQADAYGNVNSRNYAPGADVISQAYSILPQGISRMLLP